MINMGNAEELLKLVDDISAQEPIAPNELEEIHSVINGSDSITLENQLLIDPIDNSLVPAEAVLENKTFVSEDNNPSQDLRARISHMKLPEKIKLAMFGNMQCRALLITDKNRMIQGFVLKNPKMTAKEIEEFVRSPNASDFVIRTVAANNEWMKEYSIKLAIVKNSKSPIDLSLRWLKFINTNDLKILAKSKNIPQVISVSAKKKLSEQGK